MKSLFICSNVTLLKHGCYWLSRATVSWNTWLVTSDHAMPPWIRRKKGCFWRVPIISDYLDFHFRLRITAIHLSSKLLETVSKFDIVMWQPEFFSSSTVHLSTNQVIHVKECLVKSQFLSGFCHSPNPAPLVIGLEERLAKQGPHREMELWELEPYLPSHTYCTYRILHTHMVP